MCIPKQNKGGAIDWDLILKRRAQTPKLEDLKKKESFSTSIFMQFDFPWLPSLWVWGGGKQFEVEKCTFDLKPSLLSPAEMISFCLP